MKKSGKLSKKSNRISIIRVESANNSKTKMRRIKRFNKIWLKISVILEIS